MESRSEGSESHALTIYINEVLRLKPPELAILATTYLHQKQVQQNKKQRVVLKRSYSRAVSAKCAMGAVPFIIVVTCARDYYHV